MTGIVIHFWEIDNLSLKMKSGFVSLEKEEKLNRIFEKEAISCLV